MTTKLTIVLIPLFLAFSGLNKMNAQPKLWGLTSQGGTGGFDAPGVIFEFDPASPVFIHKQDFDGTNGAIPYGSLTLSGGKFYGMTSEGGAYGSGPGTYGYGVIFELDPVTNTFTKKIDFNGTLKGASPYGSLTLCGGKLYGMTSLGGVSSKGVIFEWDPVTTTFTKKIDFDGTAKGAYPNGSLTLSGGKFYGMTNGGGANGHGVIFEWDPVTDIYTKKFDFGGTNGADPSGSLTLSSGKFYGMTYGGGGTGGNAKGVIFEWDPVTNIYTKKFNFTGTNGAYPGTDPLGSLTLSDGKLYGMTQFGGANDLGVIFEWDPATNTYIDKIDFYGTDVPYNGSYPWGSLTLSGGKLYGMTSGGGATDQGVIFKWDPVSDEFNILIDFTDNGFSPYYTQLLEYNPSSWVGSVSTDWYTATNWNPTSVPDGSTDIVIPPSATFWPVFIGDLIIGTHCRSLTLSGTGSKITITGALTVP
jgi:uncharacterized repeat protein (TIGR03803 family)